MDLGCLLGGEAGGQDKGKASTLHSVSTAAQFGVQGRHAVLGTQEIEIWWPLRASRVRKRPAHLSTGLPLVQPPGGRQCQKETPPPRTSPKITLLAAISEVKP